MNDSVSSPLSEQEAVHARIARTLAKHADPRRVSPTQIPPYVRRHLPEHAAAGHCVNETTIPPAILPYLEVATLKDIRLSAELPLMPLVRKVAHAWSWEQPARNAAALRFIAAAERRDVGEAGLATTWRVPWAKPAGAGEIIARIGSFASLSATRLGDRVVVATATKRGRVELWDLASGQALLSWSLPGGVAKIAIEALRGGTALVSTGSAGGRVRSWLVRDPGSRRTAARPSAEQPPEELASFVVGYGVTALSVVTTLDGPHVLAGTTSGDVYLLDCARERRWHRPAHKGQVTGIASVEIGHGTLVAVSVGVDGWVRLTRLRKSMTAAEPEYRSDDALTAVAALRLPGGRAVAVTASDTGSVSIRDLSPGPGDVRRVRVGERDLTALAADAGPDGRALAVAAASDGDLHVVDLDRAAVIGDAIAAHRGSITGLAFLSAGRGPVTMVSGADDGIVRSWDLSEALAADPASSDPASSEQPSSLSAGPRLSAGQAAVRRWRLDDGGELGEAAAARSFRLVAAATVGLPDGTAVAVTDAGIATRGTGRSRAVLAVATAQLPAERRTVAVAATDDGQLTRWDLAPGPGQRPRLAGTAAHAGVRTVITVTRADKRPVAVSAGRDRVLRVWDLATSDDEEPPPLAAAADRGARRPGPGGRAGRIRQLDAVPTRHARQVTVLAAAAAPGQPTVVVSGSEDTRLGLWYVDSGEPPDDPLPGNRRQVTALAAAYAGGTLIALTGCRGVGVVHGWDLLRAGHPPRDFVGHEGTVTAVAIGGEARRPVVVTAGEDHTVRVWDLETAAPVAAPLPVPGAVRAIACFQESGPAALIAGDNVLAVVRWD